MSESTNESRGGPMSESTNESTNDSLSDILADLAGGSWHYVDEADSGFNMVHTYEWKLPGALLIGESVSHSGTTLSHWYWHPGEGCARMLAVAAAGAGAGAGGLAEYTRVTRDGDRLLCQLSTHAPEGTQRYREEWTFTGPDAYSWKLFHLGEGGEQEVMQARFERRP